MTGPFLNVVTGAESPTLPELLVPGLWRVRSANVHGAAVQLHGAAVLNGFAPVGPGSRPEVQWAVPRGAAGTSQFVAKLIPDDTTIASVREIVGRLGLSTSWAYSWEELAQLCPVAPGVGARAQLTVFERRIAEWLRHVEAVCLKPRSQLTIEPERMDVSRAKRIAPGAAEYLAAHTEDWHHRTLRGVEPRRVLAVTMDDDLDIYENAVVARLIDALLDHVTRRATELSRVRWLLEDAHNFATQAGGTHWRRKRIYELWGEAFVGGDEHLREQARLALEVIDDLRRRLLRLLASPLYAAVPRQRMVPATLRMTNILANDQHYKWVAKLWLARQENSGAANPEAESPMRRFQQAVDDWVDFVAVLLARALYEEGFRPSGSSGVLRRGGPEIVVAHGVRAIGIAWGGDGSFLLRESEEGSERRTLRVVAVHVGLSRGAEVAAVHDVLAELAVTRRRAAPRNQMTLLCYPGVAQERAQYESSLQRLFLTLQNDGAAGPTGDSAVVPVSPLAIDSLERMSRGLRWWLASGWSDSYPPRRRLLDRELADAIRGESVAGLRVDTDGRLVLSSRVSEADRIRVMNAAARRQTDSVARAGNRAALKSEVDGLAAWVEESDRMLRDLFSCFVCGTEAEVRAIQVRTEDQVACRCRSCDAGWGVRRCGSCGKRYPYLMPRGEPGQSEEQMAEWVDRVFGRDILAIPRHGAGEGAYICPHCGA